MRLKRNEPYPIELTDEQRSVARWQWLILSVTLVVMLLLALFEDPLIRQVQPVARLNIRQLRMVCEIIPASLACLAVGYLSVRYRVTVVARRLDFWRPTGGSLAAIYGGVLITVGFSFLGIVCVEILPLVKNMPVALTVCGGGLAALLMVVLAIRGLRRAFED